MLVLYAAILDFRVLVFLN